MPHKHSINATDANLTLNEYQERAAETDQNRGAGLGGLDFLLLGLFGEVGTLLSALKKKKRDREAFLGYKDSIYEEFGDTLWYFSNIASRAKLDLSVLAQRNFRDLHDWDEVQQDAFGTFQDIQTERKSDGSATSDEFEEALIALAGKTGLFLNDFHLKRFASNRDALSAHLTEVFRALLAAANAADVDLAEAAACNVSKINSRWPRTRILTP